MQGLDLLASLRLCSNVPGQWAVQTALGGYQSIQELVRPGGRLYVVEMGDYSERRHERLGRVKLLVDTDGDGRFDKASVFADKLAWPTAVILSLIHI